MRLRLTLLAALSSLALVGAVAVPAASAAGSPALPHTSIAPALKTIRGINGVAKNGKKFTGSYAIQGFIARNGKEYAVGTVKGMLNGRHVTRYNVLMPAKLTGGSSSSSTHAARDQTTGASCQILHLVLGPINLNLLGLQVTLGGGTAANQPIVLDLTAHQGQGLLGDLLCGLDNALGGNSGLLGQLNSNLQQLTAALNGLVGLLGGLGGL